MLTITIPANEVYNERTNEFIQVPGKTIQLEHSLISISKWESKWKIPFLDGKPKTHAQSIDYYRCMTITQNVDPMVYLGLTPELEKKINDYINDNRTATTFRKQGGKSRSREIITSELIYYWMVALEIPFECERWHLSRLLTLIEVTNIKNQPSKKMSKKDTMSQNRALNAARRAKTGSKG